jgi:hypothetical protein
MKNTVAIIAIMFSVSTATADERNTAMADQLAALALMIESEQAPVAEYTPEAEVDHTMLTYDASTVTSGISKGFQKGTEAVGSAVGVTRRVTGSVLSGVGSGFTKLGDLIK